jgi:NDP-sugar pyrophosphorylase family protein
VNLCILYAGIEVEGQVWPDKRSLALQRVAGSNVLGHVLNQLWDAHPQQVLVVVQRDEEAITAWFAEQIPHIEAKVIKVPAGTKPLQALAACRDYCEKAPLLMTLGSNVTEADYRSLERNTADITYFTKPQQENEWAGICYFQRGTDCFAVLDRVRTAEESDFAAFLEDLQLGDFHLEKKAATMCLETRTAADLLFTNARLLGLGYGTEDAIERSYMEDFTVLPPVFLHETAVIENAVIGPFANIEAGAMIKDSIVRDSLIGRESTISDVVLDGSIIGARVQLSASGHALFVEDNSQVSLNVSRDNATGIS